MMNHNLNLEALDREADFCLEFEIPKEIYPVTNPDGTAPVAMLKVKATSIQFALIALNKVRESGDVQKIIASELLQKDTGEELSDADQKLMESLAMELHDKFLSFVFVVSSGEEGEEDWRYLEVVLTAPSGWIANFAFDILTTRENLTAIGNSFVQL
jgi:hypothetical protein